jgi:alpha-methylacyl-CoA racemase
MMERKTAQGPLVGVKIVELAGIGPGPLCSALLSDMGADILRIDRPAPADIGGPRPPRADVARRGRMSVSVDLKNPEGVETILKLVEQADAILDPFRPGVTERLGLGPDACLARNKAIIYGRMTGWGQDGPMSQIAGHDLNYLALTGMLNAIGPAERPVPPLNLVADMGGAAMFLAVGVLAGIIEARQSGEGQVVDAAMVEGAAYLGMGQFGVMAMGARVNRRAANVTDGGSHFYRCYETSDGKFVSIASIERKFYANLLAKLNLDPADLPEQHDEASWPAMSKRFEEIFRQKTREEWTEIMGDTDICYAPVLDFEEATQHPHNVARGSFVEIDGVKQPRPAPHFSRTESAVQSAPPVVGATTRDGLASWGFTDPDIDALEASKAIGWQG